MYKYKTNKKRQKELQLPHGAHVSSINESVKQGGFLQEFKTLLAWGRRGLTLPSTMG